MTDYAYVLADNATVPNSIDLGNGLVAIDGVGDLTPEVVLIDGENGIYLLSTGGATNAQYVAAAGAYAEKRGYQPARPGAKRNPITNDFGVSPTPAALPDGTWTPA